MASSLFGRAATAAVDRVTRPRKSAADQRLETIEQRLKELPEEGAHPSREAESPVSPQQTTPTIADENATIFSEAGVETSDPSSTSGTACIPCSLNHLSTCAGLLSEALRFARKDGIVSGEVVSRIGLCQDELNAMERVDLRPEVVMNLAPEDRELANRLLVEGRGLRHGLENMSSVLELEEAAGTTQSVRSSTSRDWMKIRLSRRSDKEKDEAG